MMSAMNRASITILLSIVSSGAAFRATVSPKLIQTHSTPKVVEAILKVEQHWMDLAAATVDCGANCTSEGPEARGAFNTSCTSTSHSIIVGTAGDKSRLQSYMADVCNDAVMKGEKEELCLDYAQLMAHQMGEDQHANMEGGIDFSQVCMDLWQTGILSKYVVKVAELKKQKEEKLAAEEEAKREEAEVEKQQAIADEKSAEARKRLDEVANHTKLVTQKREEAVQAAVEAQRRASDVENAEEVHRRLEAQAQAAENEAKVMAAKAANHANLTLAMATNVSQEEAADASHAIASRNVTAFVALSKPVMRKSFRVSFPNTFK